MYLQNNFISIVLFLLFTSCLNCQNDSNNFSITATKKFDEDFISRIHTVYSEACAVIEKELLLLPINDVKILLCANEKEIREHSGYNVPSWVLGLAFSSRNLILINCGNLGVLANNINSVLKHEVCHLYLGQWERNSELFLPQWFNEGICEWVSGRLHIDHDTQVFEGVIANKILSFSELEVGFPVEAEKASMAYLQSRDIVNYIAERYGKNSIPSILIAYKETKDFSLAIDKVLSIPFDELESDWVASITPKYKWLWQLTQFFSLFTIMSLLVIWAYFRQQRKKRILLNRWEEEEKILYYEDIGN